jgi:S-adenosylmethionine decarboxylase
LGKSADTFEFGFGQHLMVDGYGCSYSYLSNISRVIRFLEELPDMIKMTKIMPPYAFKYEGKIPEDWGLSGFVLIAESHISVHTFPEKHYLSLDVFSCKDFDTEVAFDFATTLFGIKTSEVKIVDRGIEFPRNISAVAKYIVKERATL